VGVFFPQKEGKEKGLRRPCGEKKRKRGKVKRREKRKGENPDFPPKKTTPHLGGKKKKKRGGGGRTKKEMGKRCVVNVGKNQKGGPPLKRGKCEGKGGWGEKKKKGTVYKLGWGQLITLGKKKKKRKGEDKKKRGTRCIPKENRKRGGNTILPILGGGEKKKKKKKEAGEKEKKGSQKGELGYNRSKEKKKKHHTGRNAQEKKKEGEGGKSRGQGGGGGKRGGFFRIQLGVGRYFGKKRKKVKKEKKGVTKRCRKREFLIREKRKKGENGGKGPSGLAAGGESQPFVSWGKKQFGKRGGKAKIICTSSIMT